MLYTDLIPFQQAVRYAVQNTCVKPEAHKDTATFTIGQCLDGHALAVDRYGWVQMLNGVRVAGRDHIASPLANLQAAAEAICS